MPTMALQSNSVVGSFLFLPGWGKVTLCCFQCMYDAQPLLAY